MALPDCVPVLSISEKEKEDMIREVLEEQFGSVVVGSNPCVWSIILPTEERIVIDSTSWEVDCDNEMLSSAVRAAIDSVNQIA